MYKNNTREFMRFNALLFLVIMCLCFVSFGYSENGSNKKNIEITPENKVSGSNLTTFLYRAQKLSKLKEGVTKFKRVPEYHKYYVGKRLIKRMKKDEKTYDMEGYKHKEGTHNLNVYAGRQAWAFEHVFEVKLPKVTSEEKRLLRKYRKKANEFLNAYHQGVKDASSRQYQNELNVEKLVGKYKENTSKNELVSTYKFALENVQAHYEFGITKEQMIQKYKDNITPGLTKPEIAHSSRKNFIRLLFEWLPVGKNLNELTQIIGEKPTESTKYPPYYKFDNGFISRGFIIIVDKKGIIQGIH